MWFTQGNVCSPGGLNHHNMNIMESEHQLPEILQTHFKRTNTLIGQLVVK